MKKFSDLCMIIMYILNIVQSQYDYSFCTYYENSYFNFPEKYGQIQTSKNELNLNSNFGVGFWMSYRSLRSEDLIKNPDVTDSNLKQVFVFTYQYFDTFSILFYIDFSLDSYTITHKVLLLTKNGIKTINQEMDKATYEGDWIFVYFFIDQEQVEVIFYSAKLNDKLIQIIQENLQLRTPMESVTGGYRNVINNNEVLNLQVYSGIIEPVIVSLDYSYFDNFDEFCSNCWPLNQCSLEPKAIIPFNVTLSDNIITNSTTIFKMSYTMQGWVRLQPLISTTKQSSVLLRISTYQHNSDNNQIGDRLLYIMYYQSNTDIQQNGFTLQTYSYTFPWRPSEYKTDQSDIIYALDQEYKDLIIQWHYFQYEYGTYTNNGQPIYTVYFTSIDTIRQYTWNKQINHFTTNNLYFNIGGDEYYPNTFQGQLSNWIFNLLCDDLEQVEFKPACHYSCEKCKGITQNDCISCNQESNRVYSETQNTCKCKYGLIDQPLVTKCLQLNEYSAVFNINEQEVHIQEEGYYSKVESNIICEVGYFKYNNQCIKCPYEPQQNLIKCADCYFYPENFSQTLSCTFKFESKDEFSVLFYTQMSSKDCELFEIYQQNWKYTMRIRKGRMFNQQCKNGYFLSENNNCQECPMNCSECGNEYVCSVCDSRYKFDEEGNCVFCENCMVIFKFELDNGQDPIELKICQKGQYQTSQDLCIDCGQYCQQCSENECYYCQDQTQYFLTLDLFNCAKCSIDNCKYCFQYLIQEQVIKTSLDTSIKIDQQYSEIKTACAQCHAGYIFSFITFKCELKPQNMQDCQTGIINENQQQICLISETREDAIQQSFCTVQNCLSCIKNYSETILEFCIICIDGYYSSLKNGQCKKCPINCQTCAQYYYGLHDSWKQNIRAFYQFFINSKRDHYFEAYQSKDLTVACIKCYPNFQLNKDLICEQMCSDDCLECQLYQVTNGIYSSEKYKCNKCQMATFNQQRSVVPGSLNQCLVCPDYCSACYPRSENEITSMNPFFNKRSKYLKYSHSCYAYNNENFYNIYNLPQYMVPSICNYYQVCEKTFSMSFNLYCDLMNWYYNKQDESDIYLQNILKFDVLNKFLTQETLEYMNQGRFTKVEYNFEMIKEPEDDGCFVGTGLNFTNNWFEDVFVLQKAKIVFYKSPRSQKANIPFFLYSGFSIINYDEIEFQNIQFITYDLYFAHQSNPLANILLINQYWPITLNLRNCEILQQYWELPTIFTFTSDKLQKLTIESLNLKNLITYNSAVFNLSSQKEYTNLLHTISGLTIINSSFTDSSIFLYKAIEFSLNQSINFQNVTIMNSNFSQSYFINSQFLADYDIGSIHMENFYLDNLIIRNNSILFQISNAKVYQVKNITIKNVILQDQSSLFFCNLISAYNMFILNSYIDQGYFINVYQQFLIKKSYQTTNYVQFANVSFTKNKYSTSNSFIRILQDDQTKVNFSCNYLVMDDNNFIGMMIGIQQFSFVSYKQSLIYIDCTICNFNNINILRGIGLPEISIINSQQLQINNFHLESKKEYFQRYLHSNVECVKQFVYLDIPFTLYIWSYQNVILDNITIQNTIVADYPLIIFFGKSQTELIQQENLQIVNSVFQNNLLLILNENRQSSLIYVYTKQKLTLLIQDASFLNNHLNAYYQNNIDHSSTILLINAQQGNIILQSIQFSRNIITNSTDAVLYIQTNIIVISNCSFSNQNILTDVIFSKNLITQGEQNILIQNIYIDFPILSQGGNGYIEVSSLEIKNTSLSNSIANNGGGFYIVTQNSGKIQILNCYFYNLSTLLNGNQISSGGLFYIDSSKSSLNLTIQQCQINQTYSRTFGGAIFIDPSKSSNYLYFDNLRINSAFSIQHSFLSYTPNKLIKVSSNILISNIQFSNNEVEFGKYVSQLTELSSQNIELFQNENPIIYVLFSQVSMRNCTFFNIHLVNIIEIDRATSVNIEQLNVFNSTVFQSPILKISLRSNSRGSISLSNIVFSNIIESYLKIEDRCPNITQFYNNLICPSTLSGINQNPPLIYDQLDFQNQLLCNLNQLYSVVQKQAFSIIQLQNFNQNHFISINNIEISAVNCSACDYGILSIQQFEKVLNLQIENLQMYNNNCGVLGCLSIIQSVDDINLLQTSDLSDIYDAKTLFNTTLTFSLFVNNKAQYGGGCFLSGIDVLINKTIFNNNQAIHSGGSIYYISKNTTLLIINSQIVNNSANIGGGVFLQRLQFERFSELNLTVSENNATDFSNNLYESPRFLYLSLDKVNRQKNIEVFSNQTTIIDQIKVNPYSPYNSKCLTDVLLLPSGISVYDYKYFDPEKNTYIDFNISFRLQAGNILGEKIQDLENTKCQINANILDKQNTSLDKFEINQTNQQVLSYSTVIFNMETQDYNLDNLIIYFNPYQDINQQLQLAFICNIIQIPFYNQTSLQPDRQISNYILLLNIRTLECQIGEFFNETTGGCVLCDITQSQYSVTVNSSLCSYKDEIKIVEIEPGMIKLRSNYWRAYYYSENIEICHNLQKNCEGGWRAGDPSCATGHIGALCEQCDLYNVKGQGSFSQNQSYQCSSCDSSAGNIINIILIILWTLISVLITVTSTIQMIESFVFQLKLKPLGFYTVFKSASTSILLKVFTNYLQIVSSITSFQLSVPVGIQIVANGVGNPIGSMAFSLDCYLKSFTRIPMIYFRIIWGFVMAGLYIFLFFSIHILLSAIKKRKINITFITTTFIYIFIYLSPNQVSDLSFLISYRNISDEQWIAANVAYLYNTQEHQDWLLYFVTPTFLVIGVLLPFFFWYILYHHRLHLNSTKTRKIWGYLYNEYKLSTYYWETIKIIQKELIIIILIYYEDFVTIKACLIFFLLFLYGKLTQKFKPYLTEDLNKIDSFSTSICKISIVLAQSIYSAQSLDKTEIVWPFYLVLAAINCIFIVKMVIQILFAYFDKLYEQIDKIKAFLFQNLPLSIRKRKFCLRLLRNRSERKQVIRLRYQQVRIYLINQAKQIINLKKNNNMSLLSPTTNYIHRTFDNRKVSMMIKSTTKLIPDIF